MSPVKNLSNQLKDLTIQESKQQHFEPTNPELAEKIQEAVKNAIAPEKDANLNDPNISTASLNNFSSKKTPPNIETKQTESKIQKNSPETEENNLYKDIFQAQGDPDFISQLSEGILFLDIAEYLRK